MRNNNFRYDINGLRAYAVILVVLFHFGITGFASGFIGVDIFFVISGFLMTSIVVKSLEKGNFSLLNFYLSRGIRIVPALFVVSSILLILGWFFLLPPDYRALAKHTLSSINFFSNFIYWKEAGYFDTSSHNKALLHTWSLSVEWQFYLIFPILVALLYKIKKSRLFLLTFFILGAISSFILSIIITAQDPSAGFFLLPTRAWEMLVGGLIFFIPQEKIPYKKPLEFIGFLLIAISCYIFSTSTLWPSYNAILPVLGAFLILVAHQQDSIFTKVSIFQWIGKNSYSIYLWHWPIIFFLHYFYKNNDYIFIISGIVLSVILGWLSYKFVENPTRKYLSNLTKIKAYSLWIILIGMLSVISLVIYKMDGIGNRFSTEINNIYKYGVNENIRKDECKTDQNSNTLKQCKYGTGPVSLLVIGDSHSMSSLQGVIMSLPKNTSLIHWSIPDCSTVIGLKRIDQKNYNCGNLVKKAIDEMKIYQGTPVLVINRINTLFYGATEMEGHLNYPLRYTNQPYKSFSENYMKQMEKSYIDTLKEISLLHKVYVTSPTPLAKKDITNSFMKMKAFNIGDENNFKISINEYRKQSERSLKAQNTAKSKGIITIVDITKAYCDKNYCYFIKNNMPLFKDDDHISWQASLIFKPIFEKEIFGK